MLAIDEVIEDLAFSPMYDSGFGPELPNGVLRCADAIGGRADNSSIRSRVGIEVRDREGARSATRAVDPLRSLET